MDIIAYKCLEGFHRRFVESDSKPLLVNNKLFIEMMADDFSGENLRTKIIAVDEHWEKMLNTKGFGLGVKFDKAQIYRKELIATWKTIKEIFDAKKEVDISKLMGTFLWDIKEEEFKHSYFGVIESAIKFNKLWKSEVVSDIFCLYFGFVQGESKTLDEIAKKYNIERERVRQLKEQYINSFEHDFWFLKDILIKNKLESLFDLEQIKIDNIHSQILEVNDIENVKFSKEFYIKILSIACNMVLIGNINSIKSQNKKSAHGNIWTSLYLQTKEEHEKCNIEAIIDILAIEIHNNSYYFKEDTVVDISAFITKDLSDYEMQYYNSIIATEIEYEIEFMQSQVIIKRNSVITQPEMVEVALRELDGFAYADDILHKVTEIYPEKEWTMPILRASFRGQNFYSVGKSGLFGLKNIKDLRNEMGNGTFNEIFHIYLLKKKCPVHIYELLEHTNNLFPRSKTLHTVHTILEQNSKRYFKKFDGGFYGLSNKNYYNIEFPRVVGGHGKYLSQIIKEQEGITFENVFKIFNDRYSLLEIQVRYLLYQMIEANKGILKDGLYLAYIPNEISVTEEAEYFEVDADKIDVEIDQEELDFEELNQPDVPDELLKDALTQIKIRRGQPRFRQKLLALYKKTCIITGCNIPELLEAAHILPYSIKKDFSLSNGLLLRADIHTLFDLGMIAINPETMQLKLNSSLLESSDYATLNNIDLRLRIKKLHPEYTISEEGLYWRWESFMDS